MSVAAVDAVHLATSVASVEQDKPNKTVKKKTKKKKFKFTCVDCSVSFETRTQFDDHNDTVHEHDKPFKCDQCGFRATHKSNLNVHYQVHNRDKRFQCPHCDYSCDRKYTMKVHNRCHTGEKPFKCDICKYAAADKSNLSVHLRKHKGITLTKRKKPTARTTTEETLTSPNTRTSKLGSSALPKTAISLMNGNDLMVKTPMYPNKRPRPLLTPGSSASTSGSSSVMPSFMSRLSRLHPSPTTPSLYSSGMGLTNSSPPPPMQKQLSPANDVVRAMMMSHAAHSTANRTTATRDSPRNLISPSSNRPAFQLSLASMPLPTTHFTSKS